MTDENKKARLVNRIKNDYIFSTLFFASLSLFVGAAYILFNLYLGIKHKSAWNFGIAAYMFTLLCTRIYILIIEKRLFKSNKSQSQKEAVRVRVHKVQSILFFVTDFALIAPITLMVLQQKTVNFSTVTAITMAAYTTYKIIVAIINFKKSRKTRNLSIIMLRNVNLVDALVSVLSLQYALIMTFGGAINGDMFVVCACSSFAVCFFLITMSVVNTIKAVKRKTSDDTPTTQ